MRVPFEGPTMKQMAASLVAQQAGGVECVPSQMVSRLAGVLGPTVRCLVRPLAIGQVAGRG